MRIVLGLLCIAICALVSSADMSPPTTKDVYEIVLFLFGLNFIANYIEG